MMKDEIGIKSALISVYDKNGLEEIIHLLNKLNVEIYSTGGTEKFIRDLGVPVKKVEDLTDYPSILGGRVKTLHPKIFGGILGRRDEDSDQIEMQKFQIPNFDLVLVNLYPFEETVLSKASDEDIIEKIDIGGISLIRAGGKNHKDVVIIPSPKEYPILVSILKEQKGNSYLAQRRGLAKNAFFVSQYYDRKIFEYFQGETETYKLPEIPEKTQALRYGENPHQMGYYHGDFSSLFDKLHGKELSYNNLVDIDAGILLMKEFTEPTFAILKHNNPCGIASRNTILEAWKLALAADPVSAFGGVLISNTAINLETAQEINKIFFEVLVAPSYSEDALKILMEKKNRIILIQKHQDLPKIQYKTLLNGIISQDKDLSLESPKDWKLVTKRDYQGGEIGDLEFGLKIVKHTKSNAIIIVKDCQMIGIGLGQTSRVDALNQALSKAEYFGFNVIGSSMASDAFFPFPDCVEIAAKAGISAIIQPGGSVKDQESIKASDENKLTMALTGIRHFKH